MQIDSIKFLSSALATSSRNYIYGELRVAGDLLVPFVVPTAGQCWMFKKYKWHEFSNSKSIDRQYSVKILILNPFVSLIFSMSGFEQYKSSFIQSKRSKYIQNFCRDISIIRSEFFRSN